MVCMNVVRVQERDLCDKEKRVIEKVYESQVWSSSQKFC